MKETLLEILEELKPGVDYENETQLITRQILTSMEVVRLIMMISDEFDISISPLYIVPENFESVDDMVKLIEKVQDE
ncbi:MAG: hypothetical protein NC090_02270 [Anaeroplasma bactoclasticum]|nr:hypothetical protein [Staphylococcus sp.]MCM1513790.1 hypothetical protein [Anaeroplasma bactoclasticum]